MQIRPLQLPDRDRIESIVRAVENFNSADVTVALELVDDALAKGDASDYTVVVLEDDSGTIQGYGCYGLRPLTLHTYDIYWMAVTPECQGRGYGRHLFDFVEAAIRQRGGKLVILETSSQESYSRTLRFYDNSGYILAGRIPDFYRDGDDILILYKRLDAPRQTDAS